MKITPIKTDSLPRPRCSPQERADYNKACELEQVNVNQNARSVLMAWVSRIFKKHGIEKGER